MYPQHCSGMILQNWWYVVSGGSLFNVPSQLQWLSEEWNKCFKLSSSWISEGSPHLPQEALNGFFRLSGLNKTHWICLDVGSFLTGAANLVNFQNEVLCEGVRTQTPVCHVLCFQLLSFRKASWILYSLGTATCPSPESAWMLFLSVCSLTSPDLWFPRS